jgi:hypothetical protein
MQDTEIIKPLDLQMKAIVLEAVLPSRSGFPGTPVPEGWEDGGKTDRKVTFIVDTETWECQGQVSTNDPVLADEDWWAAQCQKVSDRVRAQIKSTAA